MRFEKLSDKSVVCLESSTAKTLAKRGWGFSLQQELSRDQVVAKINEYGYTIQHYCCPFARSSDLQYVFLQNSPKDSLNFTVYYSDENSKSIGQKKWQDIPFNRNESNYVLSEFYSNSTENRYAWMFFFVSIPRWGEMIFADPLTGEIIGHYSAGCRVCVCLSADTQIDTPNGKINVKDIRDGTIVWSVDKSHNKIQSKIIMINKVFVGDAHKVIDLQLADGRELFASPNHPTYDGGIIADLKVGEIYDESTVKSMELVEYKHQFTYDILPDTQTGDYFANDILVGSTLK